jgi:hypothetical protein
MEIIRMAAGGQANASEEEEFMWRYVISDIFKDHRRGYQPEVIRGLLPIFPPGSSPDNYMSNKETLLDSLITLNVGGRTLNTGVYDTLQSLPHLANGDIELKLFNTQCRYLFTVFNREEVDTPESVSIIKAATLNGWLNSTSIILTSDTSVHTDRILAHWTSPINEKYSRESVWDPAFRSEAGKCSETSPPNPTSVLYSRFNRNLDDKLSYLFINYDVYLAYDRRRVYLEYRKGDVLKRVNGDANTAGLILSLVEKAIRCFKGDAATLNKIEGRYIGKYSGDGCLRISQFRNTMLNAPCNQATFNYDMQLNETYDGIYFTGLLAAQSDAIWFHTNDKKRLIVFSKVNNQVEYIQGKVMRLLEMVIQNLGVFMSAEAKFQKKLAKVNVILNNFKTYRFLENSRETRPRDKYVEVLIEFTKYSILYNKSLKIEERLQEMRIKHTQLNDTINNVISDINNLIRSETPISEDTIKILENIQADISPYLQVYTDIKWASTLFTGDALQDVTIEDLVISKMASRHGVGWKVTYESVFKAITLNVDPNIKERVSRFFHANSTSAWGLDIIKNVYKILEGIPVDENTGGGGASAAAPAPAPAPLHIRFIDTLRNTLTPTLQTEFDLRMNTIGIPTPQRGGRYIHKKTYKSKKYMRKTTKVYKQRGGAFTVDSYRQELEIHANFINKFLKVEDLSANHLVNSTFNYIILSNPLALLRKPSPTQEQPKRDRSRSRDRDATQVKSDQRGGATNVYEYNMDFLEFYEDILGKDHPSIIRLLNRYSIMNYVNKNSLNDIEKSVHTLEDMPGSLPDPMKEVAIDAIYKVKASVLAIHDMCKSDIVSHPEYIDITDEIDVHLGQAHTFLKVAESAYAAGKEYADSKYDKAIEYLEEVLKLYSALPSASAGAATEVTDSAGAGVMATDESIIVEGTGYASPPPEQIIPKSYPFSPDQWDIASQSQATLAEESALQSQAQSQFVSPFTSPRRARPPPTARELSIALGSAASGSHESANESEVHMGSSAAGASAASGSYVSANESEVHMGSSAASGTSHLETITLTSLLDKIEAAKTAIKQERQEKQSNATPENVPMVEPRANAGGASARRLTFSTSSNRKPQRKTQRKPRR